MQISLFGLGYVGAVTGACLAQLGHRVTGVDLSGVKLEMLRAGKSPILEAGLDELIAEQVASGRLTVTSDCDAAVAGSEISLVCVGTPSQANGSLRTDYVERVSADIGKAIRRKGTYHSVVIRSTVLPGTTDKLLRPILERESGRGAGDGFGLSMHPEFLREGTSIHDFFDPPMTLIGTASAEEFSRVAGIYQDVGGSGKVVGGEFRHCAVPTAEAMKYACNIFHAVKITFANEIGLFAKQAGVDSREVMDLICRDTKLNISPRYLRPGFAFGGSCLPKDLKAFLDFGRKQDVSLSMLEGALASNRLQIERVAQKVQATGKRKVAMLGISFKEGTDDLRESPLVHLAELLIGRGYDLRIFDPHVRYASLHGANKEFIDRELPHLKSVLVDGKAAIDHGEVVIAGHGSAGYRDLGGQIRADQLVLDLCGAFSPKAVRGQYEGLYW